MEPDCRKEIEQIIGELQCPKDYICYKSGFSTLCKAEDIGFEPFLECFEESQEECPFSLSYASLRYCDCPLRFYIARKLKR